MTNNRGYIWKGVWFFGLKEDYPINSTLIMHEILNDRTNIWTIKKGVKNLTVKYRNKKR